MLIADLSEFHWLADGAAYAAGHAPDGSSFQVVGMRATYSTTHVDLKYAPNIAQARRGGLKVIHYGYMAAADNPVVAGRFFAATVKNYGGLWLGDSIWCDCEEGAGDQASRVTGFLQGAHSVLNDNVADEGFYSGAAFYAGHNLSAVSGVYHRWIAAYGQGSWPPYGEDLWQFTDAEQVPGVYPEGVDCSIFNGDLNKFLLTFGYSASPTPAPPPAPAPQPQPIPGENMQQLIVNMPIGPGGEGEMIFDGGANSLKGVTSAKEAIPYSKFLAATAYGPCTPAGDPDWGPIHLDQQDRNNFLYLHARNAPPAPAGQVALRVVATVTFAD